MYLLIEIFNHFTKLLWMIESDKCHNSNEYEMGLGFVLISVGMGLGFVLVSVRMGLGLILTNVLHWLDLAWFQLVCVFFLS